MPVSEGSRSRDSLKLPDRSSLAIDIVSLSRRRPPAGDRLDSAFILTTLAGTRISGIAMGRSRRSNPEDASVAVCVKR
jgi:hypothetical protein